MDLREDIHGDRKVPAKEGMLMSGSESQEESHFLESISYLENNPVQYFFFFF